MWHRKCKQHVKIWKFESKVSERSESVSQFNSESINACISSPWCTERMCWKWQNANTVNRFTAEQTLIAYTCIINKKNANSPLVNSRMTLSRDKEKSRKWVSAMGWGRTPFSLFLKLYAYFCRWHVMKLSFSTCVCVPHASLRRLQIYLFLNGWKSGGISSWHWYANK